jgi:tripartite ATP-independent transporter DctP family solute receptor
MLFVGCSRGPEAIKPEYRMQVTVGPTTYWGMGAARFAALVGEKTGGRINVKPYYGSQLLKGAQLNAAQMVAMGSIDVALDSTINMSPILPEMNLFSLPFFIDTYADVDRIENGEAGRILHEAMRQKRLAALGWGENGFRWLTNSKRAVQTPEDVKGLKIRVVGSPIFVDIFRTLDADPINMNWGDAVTAFQQGVVDGQENPAQILLAVNIDQYHKHLTQWTYVIDPLVLYWNLKQFNEFPSEIQSAIRDAAAEACAYQKELARTGLDGVSLSTGKGITPDPFEHFREKGVTITRLTDEQRDAFRTATHPVFEKWQSRVGQTVIDAARRDMEE